jgi:hypothetical protein
LGAAQVIQKLPGNFGYGNVIDVDLVLPYQEKKQIQGALKIVQLKATPARLTDKFFHHGKYSNLGGRL